MIICDNNNIDIIQGVIGYGNAEGITDWRIENTSTGVFNILNNTSATARLSIIDNGNIGIRTTPSISSSKFYINGFVSCSGIYKKNNRNILNDTSNYVLSTSNILVSRILTDSVNQWKTTTNNITYYNSSNVGIGTANPTSKLHLYDDSVTETKLTITNNNSNSQLLDLISSPAANVSGTITSSTDKFMIFTTTGTNYIFTIPSGGVNCDILMIGGGGGSGWGGGGAGACIVAINQTLPAGSCIVRVGNGDGNPSITNGEDSFITVGGNDRYRAKGGGTMADRGTSAAGVAGGCGSGAALLPSLLGGAAVMHNVVNGITDISPSTTSTYSVLGTSGGNGGANGAGGGGIGGGGNKTPYQSYVQGGGGAGGAGLNQVVISGTTYNFKTWFANGGTFGYNNNGYIGGGGGGMNGGAHGNGGSSDNTGNGGRPGGYKGDSGIIIIRYRTSIPPITTPSIELIRGSINDSNRDYKISNYIGDFIIKSSLSGTDTDYIKITGTTGAITNPTGTTSWTTSSDKRIKENIEIASYDKCYESINKLELNRFNYIKGFNTVNRDITQLGFIAQEVKEIFPKSVFENSYINDSINISDLHSIDVSQINYSLYGAVKKLIEIINEDEEKIKKIENTLNIDIDTTLTSNIDIIDSTLTSNIDSTSSNIDIIDSISIITE